MAILWGPYASHFRLGIDIIVNSGNSRTIILYGQNRAGYAHSWTYPVSRGGSWGGTTNLTFNSGTSGVVTREIYRTTQSFTGARTWTASVHVAWGGATASVSRSLTIDPPAPSPTPPAAPTGLSAVRNTDTRNDLSWTNRDTYSSLRVQRRAFSGSWAQIGSPGFTTTFADLNVLQDSALYYRVAGYDGLLSSWSNVAGPVYTKPLVPTVPTAQKVGSDVRVRWDFRGNFALGAEVQREGGPTAVVGTGTTAAPSEYFDPSPVGAGLRYRVRSFAGPSGQRAYSDWSAWSNTVVTIAPPNAPTGLSPNGGLAVADTATRLSWVHNPVDTTDQEAAEVRYRVGTGSWTTVMVSDDQFLDVALSSNVYEWQVRTKGQHATYSPWSATATVTVINRPTVNIISPAGDYFQSRAVVEWEWGQAEGRPQSAWQVELVQDGVVLESRSGSGAATTFTFATTLVDAQSYVMRARAATGNVWSEWDESPFTAIFLPPALPEVSVSWDEGIGAHTIAVSVGADVPDTLPTEYLTIERSLDGETWETVADNLEGESVVQDWEGRVNGSTFYRVTATTELPSSASVVFESVSNSAAIWLAGGIGFQVAARLPFNPTVTVDGGRERSTQRYAGRSLPVAYAGEQLTRSVQVSGSLVDGDPESTQVEDLVRLAQEPSPVHLYRDPDGRCIYGVVSNVPVPRDQGGLWGYSFSLDETTK